MASVRKRVWKTATDEVKSAWVVDYTDTRGERQRKHFLQKKAADAFRIQIESQMQAGIYRPDAEKVTVKEVCESFLEHCEGRHERDERMTRKMLTVYKGHINNHILHAEARAGQPEVVAHNGSVRGRFPRPASQLWGISPDHPEDISHPA